jgi:peptidyl-prolyl cis-trans isomerase SurA
MEDYRNGIYIFKLQEEEVWDRVKVDTTKLYGFYNQTKGDYNWNDRVDFSEIYIKKDSLANYVHGRLQNGDDFADLARQYNQRSGLGNDEGKHGVVAVEGNELAAKAFDLAQPGDFTQPVKYQNGWSIVKLNKKLPAGPKTFEEAKAEVASAYQEKLSQDLEKEYLSRLNSIYKPEKYYDKLEKGFRACSQLV